MGLVLKESPCINRIRNIRKQTKVTDSMHGKCEIYKNISKREWIEDMNLRVYGRIILKYKCSKTNVMVLVRSS